MAEKKKFLLRISDDLYSTLEKWAADELRSVNAQVEYLLTEAVRKSGRSKQPGADGKSTSEAKDGSVKAPE
ncbi:MAG: hypothetical protein M1469_02925 [Bacteroidetes bacterium]|nr:hypothetical protein [Bacteroidota bacterium]